MGMYTANLPTLFISSGLASSSILTGFEDASALIIMAPAACNTITIRVATESDGVTASATWADYQSGGNDVTVTAGNAVQFTPPLAGSLILVSSGPESAQRAFQVQKKFGVGGA